MQRQYKFTGEAGVIERIVAIRQQVLTLRPNDHPSLAIYLSNLGTIIRMRFLRFNAVDDINRAIELIEHAVSSTPRETSARAMYLYNLGTALHQRYIRTKALDDLDRAITTLQEAVASITRVALF